MHENEHFDAEWQGIKKLTYLMQKVEKTSQRKKHPPRTEIFPLTIPEVASEPV